MRRRRPTGLVQLGAIVASIFAGVYVNLGVAARLGAEPGQWVHKRGVAQVTSCGRDWSRLGLVHACTAEVRWRVRVDNTGTPREEPVDLRARETVRSITALSGQVDVVQRGGRRSTLQGADTVPAGHPLRTDLSWLWLPTVVPFALAGIGVAVWSTRFYGRRQPPRMSSRS
ncbi:MAG: hypothetical protein ACRDOO_01135 [Actinomadura sp.]